MIQMKILMNFHRWNRHQLGRHRFVFFHQISIFINSKSKSIESNRIKISFGIFRPVAMVKRQSITIINDDDDLLELYSISGTNIQFYSSVFSQMILPRHGGNTSIDIYFLPRTTGPMNSTFTIKTNRGHFYYHVNKFFAQVFSSKHFVSSLILGSRFWHF